MRRPPCAAALLLLACFRVAAAQEEGEFDPRQIPPRKEIKALVSEVRKSWKRATDAERKRLCERLAGVDHDLTLAALVDLLDKAKPEVVLHGVAQMEFYDDYYLARHLPRFLARRGLATAVFRAAVEMAVVRQIWECLPHIRKLARKHVALTGETEEEARLRTLCIEALGRLPHEDSLDVLIEIMESYAALEDDQIAHGSSGNQLWPRYYIPARTSFSEITRSAAEDTARARKWMAANPDFTVPRPARVDPHPDHR